MEQYKITAQEVAQNNVKGVPDRLDGTPQENKNIFDRLPELIVGRFNGFIDGMKSNFYSREETERAISARVVEIGSSDMTKAVYDADNDGRIDNVFYLKGGKEIPNNENQDLNNCLVEGNYFSNFTAPKIKPETAWVLGLPSSGRSLPVTTAPLPPKTANWACA